MKLCDTCIYGSKTEYFKPCIIYRDNCEYYEREEDMKAIIQIDVPDYQIGQEVSIYFKDTMMIKGIVQEPKTGHWIEKDGFDGDVYYDCSECGESWITIEGTPWDNAWNYCPNCGARMESEDKE